MANYAKKYGPSAAAKKFDIPPSVASYYYRKSFGRGDAFLKSSPENTDASQMSDDGAPQAAFPGCIRGRGRGRPKLIGDELDDSLVDFIIEYKKNNGVKDLTTIDTLTIAKQYIKLKSPGLLQDDGGSVNLKLTWALKLQSRVAEKEQKISRVVDENVNVVPDTTGVNRGKYPSGIKKLLIIHILAVETQVLQLALLNQLSQLQSYQSLLLDIFNSLTVASENVE